MAKSLRAIRCDGLWQLVTSRSLWTKPVHKSGLAAAMPRQVPGEVPSLRPSCRAGEVQQGKHTQLQSCSLCDNVQTQWLAHPHVKNLSVFNFTDCFLSLIRFLSWNEIMRQLWQLLPAYMIIRVWETGPGCQQRARPLLQAAWRALSSERPETLLQLQHWWAPSLPHSSWVASLDCSLSTSIPLCFRGWENIYVRWCYGVYETACQEMQLGTEHRSCLRW